MDKLLLIGADGATGKIITNGLITQTDLQIFSPTINELDYRNTAQIKKYLEFQPDGIFLIGAYTNVDKAQKEDTQLCWDINQGGIENFLKTLITLQDQKIYTKTPKIIYISTDMVGAGEKPLTEDTDVWTNPKALNEYGKSKLAGEMALKNSFKNHPEHFSYHIVRIATPFSGLRKGSFLTLLYNTVRLGNSVKLVTDQYITPTLAENLAKNLLLVYKHSTKEVYHDTIRDEKRWSVYDMGIEFVTMCGWDTRLISPMTIQDMYELGYWIAPRGTSNELEVKNLLELPGVRVSSVSQTLEKFRKKYVQNHEEHEKGTKNTK